MIRLETGLRGRVVEVERRSSFEQSRPEHRLDAALAHGGGKALDVMPAVVELVANGVQADQVDVVEHPVLLGIEEAVRSERLDLVT